MLFPSKHATKIWDTLRELYIPDQLTLSSEYLKVWGTPITGDPKLDKELTSNFVLVKINIVTILEYYNNGLELRIPDRSTMLSIHTDIEEYLVEWREHIKYDINLDVNEYKDFIISLENLSKTIYGKMKNKELIKDLFVSGSEPVGIRLPFDIIKKPEKEQAKPDYESISTLIRSRTRDNRYR